MVLAQIDELLGRAGLEPGETPRLVEGRVGKGTFEMTSLTTAWLAGIERLTAPGSKHRELAAGAVEKGAGTTTGYLVILGVLNALRKDYELGYMRSLAELIHADVFADFLEMAQELLDKNYKDPAAVITGSVIEEHLRKLAVAASIPTEESDGRARKADSLNADLAKAHIYDKLEQKSVLAWLDLRNKAAHGHYETYVAEQVALMLEGVRGFLTRHPA